MSKNLVIYSNIMRNDILKNKKNIIFLILIIVIIFLNLIAIFKLNYSWFELSRFEFLIFDVFAVFTIIYFVNIGVKNKVAKYSLNGILYILGGLLALVCILSVIYRIEIIKKIESSDGKYIALIWR